MTVAQQNTLKDEILEIILNSQKPLLLADFETRLTGKFENTFDVRETVWQLIREGKAKFTPEWSVEKNEGSKKLFRS